MPGKTSDFVKYINKEGNWAISHVSVLAKITYNASSCEATQEICAAAGFIETLTVRKLVKVKDGSLWVVKLEIQ